MIGYSGIRRIFGAALAALAIPVLSGCPFAPPFADFSGTPTEGDAPLTVRFEAIPGEGSTEIQRFLWDFGDGSQTADENPSHTFEEPGFYRVSLSVTNGNGSSTETKEAYIHVLAVPDAAFSASPQTGNTPLTVQFRDESITEPFQATAWRWTFGDGEVSTEQNPAHEYVQPGAYTVSLTVTTDGGSNTEMQQDFIVVSAVPAVDFEATPTAGSAPLTVNFTDASISTSSEITTWFWEFGDGMTSSDQNPAHTYADAGIYSVSLTAQNAAGNATKTETNLITVTQRPTAAFSGTPLSGGAPLVVRFTDQSVAGSSPITEWLWDFGDGTSSQQRNPIHEFSSPGEYDIALTVTTDAGMDLLLKKKYVVALTPPTADFSASVTRGEAPLSVTFTDLSDPGASPITGRQWNFGDGTFSGDAMPVHLYTTPGLYTVTLQVETAVDDDLKIELAFIEVVAKPVASLTASPTSGETPLTVNFTDTSDPGSSPITEWQWEFGDGTTSDEQHPTRVYNAAGLYTVRLRVTTAEGASSVTRNDLIRVVQGPRADFSATPTRGTGPLAVQFRDATDGGSESVTTRVWDFGDGTTSTSEDPLHTYQQPGIYTVSLTVTTAAGPDTERKTGYITVDPAVDFSLTPSTGKVPATVTFTDTTAATPLTISNWAWDFGDGGTSTVQHPVHTYTAAGSYEVTLTVTTEQGEASAARTAAVNLRPQVVFSGEPLTGAGAPHVVQFMDETDPGNLVIRGWDWNFGDGTHSTVQNPEHTFTTPDVYSVSLTVLTDIGSSATTESGYVVVRPEAAFSANVTAGVDTLAVQFTDETDPGNLELLTWAWDFGDGATSGFQNPAHTYTQPGAYTVTLTTNSSEGPDTETKAGYIVVMPRVDFSATPLSGPFPLEVSFTDLTNAGVLAISAWAWDVGEGDPIMEETPTYTYAMPGMYDVTLTITTAQGDVSATKETFIEVVPVLASTPAITPSSGSASVVFANDTDLGGLTGATWLWNFGDGGTSTQASPTHNFANPGVYPVTLSVDTAEGISTSRTVATIVVEPVPSFTASATTGISPQAIQFTDTSNIGSLTVSGWAWDFGDGGTSTEQHPMHTFAIGGAHDVSLTITTEAGTTSVDTPTSVHIVPKPAFTGTPLMGAPTLSVSFTNTTDPGTATVNDVLWDFGDGSTSTDPMPTHDFTMASSFTVSLTINTSEGSATETKTDYVDATPVIDFSASTVNGPAPLVVTFTDTTFTGNLTVTERVWDFGDGSGTVTTPGDTADHTYTTPGTYTAMMTLVTTVGNFTGSLNTMIEANPVPLFSSDIQTGPGSFTVQFTDDTVGGNVDITNRIWDFGDGTMASAAGASINHTYTSAGTYDVGLTIETDIQGELSVSQASYITAHPLEFSIGGGAVGIAPHPITVTNTTMGGDLPILTTEWDYGDGSSQTASTMHTYTELGAFPVSMIITTSQGSQTYVHPTPIQVTLDFDFGTDVDEGPAIIDVLFTDSTDISGATVVSRTWDFGDGSTPVVVPAPTATVAHQYTNSGTSTLVREATLTINTDSLDLVSTFTRPVTIHPISFSSNITSGADNLNVIFTDSTSVGDLSITNRFWDFMDGATANSADFDIAHRYNDAGSYRVEMTITTSQGNMATAVNGSGDILVAPLVDPRRVSANRGPKPFELDVIDNTEVGNLTGILRKWTWGDGSSDEVSGTTATHEYTTAGCFDATMELITDQGAFSNNAAAIRVTVEEVSTLSSTSGLSNNASSAGIMFDLVAAKDLRLSSVALTLNAGADPAQFYLYRSTGSTSVGIESNNGQWTPIVSGFSPPIGPTATIMLGSSDFVMSQSQSQGVYVVNNNYGSGGLVRHHNPGVASSAMYTDGQLTLLTNAAKGSFSDNHFDGATAANRWFTGSVTYIHELVCALSPGGLAVQPSRNTFEPGVEVPDAGSIKVSVDSETLSSRTADGGWVALVADSLTGIESGLVLLRTDRDLSALWELDLAGMELDALYDIHTSANSDLLLVGPSSLNGRPDELLLVRLDGDGNFLWWQTFDGASAASYRALTETADGGLLLLTAEASDGMVTPVVYCVDPNRNLLWSTVLPVVETDEHWIILERTEGSIEVFGSAGFREPAWSVQLNGEGMIVDRANTAGF